VRPYSLTIPITRNKEKRKKTQGKTHPFYQLKSLELKTSSFQTIKHHTALKKVRGQRHLLLKEFRDDPVLPSHQMSRQRLKE
jgi:hypothetical protein